MPSLTIIPTQVRHAPTAIVRLENGRELLLHSRVNPLEEAAFFAANVKTEARTLYVILGFGMGYHVQALLQRIPASSQVMVLEPADVRLSARALAQPVSDSTMWLRDSRLRFLAHHDPHLTPLDIANDLAARRLLSITMVPHVPSMQTAGLHYSTLAQEIPAALPATIRQQLDTLDQMLESDLRNYWANLAASWNESRALSLTGQWENRPAVIVSSGPSLDAALPLLPAIRDKVMLIATGGTARILVTHGIRPDLVVSVDPRDPNLTHFVGWDSSNVPLVYYHRIHRGIPRVYAGPLFGFDLQDEAPLPLLDQAVASPFRRGGTAAFAALQLAHVLGANPVVFVGHDFSFAHGHTHAADAIDNQTFDDRALPPDYVRVAGTGGGTVVTSRRLHAARLHMQDYVLHYSAVRPAVRHVNTSTTGALINGMETLDLLVALGPYAPAPVTAAQVIAAVQAARQSPASAAQTALLDTWISELQAVVTAVETTEAFPEVFAAFSATPLCDLPGRSYRDLWFVFEAKYQRGDNSTTAAFVSRFKSHLRHVLDGLRATRATS